MPMCVTKACSDVNPAEFPMENRRITPERIIEELSSLYGIFEQKPRYNALDELIFTVLTQHTSDLNAERAFDRLRETIPTWEEVIVADQQAIADAIFHGGMSNQKSKRIKDILADIEVVDAPACVVLSGIEPIRPPRIFLFFWVQVAKGVHIAHGEDLIEPLSLHGKKPGALLIGFGVFQINLVVGGVDVAADDDRATFLL